MKRWIVRGLVLLLLVAAGIGVWAGRLFIEATGEQTDSALERWVRGQLVGVASQYLRPTLELGAFDYQYPDVIVLDDVKLKAERASGDSSPVEVLTVRRVRLRMASAPKAGQPLHIRELILEQPTLRAIAAEPGGLGFIGWSDLLKAGDVQAQPADAEPVRLSDVFRIELIRVHDAALEYDPRLPDTDPMRLKGVTTVLKVEPEQGHWYGLRFAFDRPPLLSVKAEGRVDIDAMVLEVASAELSTRLDREAMSHLPPQVQSLIQQHDVAGALTVSGSGRLTGGDLRASTAAGRLRLSDAGAAYEQVRLTVDRFEADLTLSQSVLNVTAFTGELLRGTISGNGRVRFEHNDVEASLTLRDLHLEDTIRSLSGDGQSPPAYAGSVSGRVTLGAMLDDLAGAVRGGGELHIREGRLGKLPVVSDLGEAVHGLTKATPVGQLTKPSDTADVVFTFEGDRVRFSGIDIRTAMVAARGNGTMDFRGQLDLLLNAGPLEKVQSLLGGVGELLGKLTDQLAKYHVTGPADDPAVKVKLGPSGE